MEITDWVIDVRVTWKEIVVVLMTFPVGMRILNALLGGNILGHPSGKEKDRAATSENRTDESIHPKELGSY